MEVYTKFLNYKLENTRQKTMDWLAFLENKCTEMANTGHKMDDEMFITHLLNSLPQSEYEGAILVIKEKLRKGDVELPKIEQFRKANIKQCSMLWAGMKRKRKTIMPSSQANPIRKSPRKHLKDIVGTVESLDKKQQIVQTRKATKMRTKKSKMSPKRNPALIDTLKERGIRMSKTLSVLILVNMDILHEIA